MRCRGREERSLSEPAGVGQRKDGGARISEQICLRVVRPAVLTNITLFEHVTPCSLVDTSETQDLFHPNPLVRF
jgi:hypothetical protein